MPMRAAPSRVSGNELSPPRTADASAGSSSDVAMAMLTPRMGASRMPDSPDIALPAAQFTAATERADQPSVLSASGFSATALVARPKRV